MINAEKWCAILFQCSLIIVLISCHFIFLCFHQFIGSLVFFSDAITYTIQIKSLIKQNTYYFPPFCVCVFFFHVMLLSCLHKVEVEMWSGDKKLGVKGEVSHFPLLYFLQLLKSKKCWRLLITILLSYKFSIHSFYSFLKVKILFAFSYIFLQYIL